MNQKNRIVPVFLVLWKNKEKEVFYHENKDRQ